MKSVLVFEDEPDVLELVAFHLSRAGMGRDRHLNTVPVIILSARGSTDDRVLGLELGAVDYVPKPFSPRELVLRVRAVLKCSAEIEGEKALVIGPLTIDRAPHRVQVEGQGITLTATEFRPGKLGSAGDMIQTVRGFGYRFDSPPAD